MNSGIEIPEKITFDELEDILYQVHEAKPDIYPYFTGNGEMNYLGWLQQYESFGLSLLTESCRIPRIRL